jgi:hypothetical protein
MMVISSPKRKIMMLSPAFYGSVHDYAVLKSLLSPDLPWFKEHRVLADLGYQGFAKDYSCREACLPHKRKRGRDLTEQQKAENREKASGRICVEHSIAGLKRYRIVSDRLRMRDIDLYNDTLEVCAGLWNFNLSN